MKGYKGFDKNFKCRDKQYSENTTYEEKDAEICESGMHFCEDPFSVFEYYPPCDVNGNLNRFAEVEALDETKTDDNEKYCTKKLHIGAELSFGDFIKAGVKFILDRVKSSDDNTGNYSASTNTGDCSASTNTGYRSASTNTGNYSASTNTGNYSASTNTGDCSVSTNTGYRSASKVEGKESVAMAIGYKSKAAGALGCWIVLAEWDSEGEHIIRVKSHKVDGKVIKPDTFYRLENNKFVEADKEEK